jgi:hypothetical protein
LSANHRVAAGLSHLALHLGVVGDARDEVDELRLGVLGVRERPVDQLLLRDVKALETQGRVAGTAASPRIEFIECRGSEARQKERG